ncbi:hypothetical protein MGYG_07952 [Nannizzia gypsea CBS 118893]|uniref:Uncharacterized protein n=1 Tax=Arthroderma gypseum (strain ATCC MYA-4604 / CBS 118893) TaxID=535722 RepID=E4V4M6_ARTGP|nr:hypothetical protein MGYG_07952 [Nannizzia gypsea CBS 118893]EFR04950.1 hypothetical protein MGYG_07952 [Nannizzia gypsea CBS 118893]
MGIPELSIDQREITLSNHSGGFFYLALYGSGAPFFTKDAFQDVYRQLKSNVQQGDKVLLKGADGVTIEYDIEVGKILEADDPDLEYVTMKPYLNYTSPLLLIEGVYSHEAAYCGMRVYHILILRNKHTKEPIETEILPSIDTVFTRFKRHLEVWESSKTCLELQATLDRMEFPANFKIDKIVVFAYRISQTSEDWLHPLANIAERRVSYQHGTYGIVTHEDPEGFLLIDDTTLVISIMPNVPVKETVAHIAQPAMIVWDADDGKKTLCTDPTSSRVKDFLKGSYSKTEFPHDPDNFKSVSIYTKLSSPHFTR